MVQQHNTKNNQNNRNWQNLIQFVYSKRNLGSFSTFLRLKRNYQKCSSENKFHSISWTSSFHKLLFPSMNVFIIWIQWGSWARTTFTPCSLIIFSANEEKLTFSPTTTLKYIILMYISIGSLYNISLKQGERCLLFRRNQINIKFILQTYWQNVKKYLITSYFANYKSWYISICWWELRFDLVEESGSRAHDAGWEGGDQCQSVPVRTSAGVSIINI